MLSVVSVLMSMVVWMVMCRELVMCVFFSGWEFLYFLCRVIRFGILILVMLSFVWFYLVSDRFLMMYGLLVDFVMIF